MKKKDAIDRIADILIRRKASVAVAESVTGGGLQAALSSGDNARQYFQGGITAYNLGQKAKLLNVEPIHAVTAEKLWP